MTRVRRYEGYQEAKTKLILVRVRADEYETKSRVVWQIEYVIRRHSVYVSMLLPVTEYQVYFSHHREAPLGLHCIR